MDDRFKELKSDPRYLEMPQKAKKVKIDKARFGKVFDKKSEFNTIGKFDKTGKRVDQKDKMMDKYYQLGEDDAEGKKFYDEEGNFNWDQQSSSSSSSSDGSEIPA
jgi:hypothetical protein